MSTCNPKESSIVISLAKKALSYYFILGFFVWVVTTIVVLFIAVHYAFNWSYAGNKDLEVKLQQCHKTVSVLTKTTRECRDTLEGLNEIAKGEINGGARD